MSKPQSFDSLTENISWTTIDVDPITVYKCSGYRPPSVNYSMLGQQATQFALTYTYFRFGNSLYIFKLTALLWVICLAPQYANIVLSDLKQYFISACFLIALLCLRLIDDHLLSGVAGRRHSRNVIKSSATPLPPST